MNLDIFSIAIDFFAFNEPGSGHRLSIHNYLTPRMCKYKCGKELSQMEQCFAFNELGSVTSDIQNTDRIIPIGASLFYEKSIAISLAYKSKMCQIEQCVNYDLSCIQAFINTTAFCENLGSQLLLQSF